MRTASWPSSEFAANAVVSTAEYDEAGAESPSGRSAPRNTEDFMQPVNSVLLHVEGTVAGPETPAAKFLAALCGAQRPERI